MFAVQRTTAADARFAPLVVAIDTELRARYGPVQAVYAPHNLIGDDTPVVLAADESGVAIGCGSFRRYDTTSVEIKRMYVAPAARRRGIARALLAELELWAREQRYSSAVLETGTGQPEAVALYERCGYVHVPHFPPYVGLPLSVCMRKAL
jgi:GNAT superfamily N-acetyltransferase